MASARIVLLIASVGAFAAFGGSFRSVVAQEEPPAAPTDLVAYSTPPFVNHLSWRGDERATEYVIDRSVVGADGPWEEFLRTDAGTFCRDSRTDCSFSDIDLEPDTDYWYRVAAFNEFGQSPYSNLAMAGPPSPPTPRPLGRIRGVVFHDRNEDGIRDPGEEGLPYRNVVLNERGSQPRTASTAQDGAFTLEADPGEYDLEVELGDTQGICVDTAFSFHPLSAGLCAGPLRPWTATMPTDLRVTVHDGETTEVAVAARPIDAAVFVGRVYQELERAPAGARVEALVNGRVCGTSTVTEGGSANFEIQVLGERERPGCARHGDLVTFRVDGVQAAETVSWEPFIELPHSPQFRFLDLVAMEDHAWYWMEAPAVGLPGDGTPVYAFVGNTLCGETVLRIVPPLVLNGSPIAGFSELIVPSAELQPGCGTPGATVTFRTAGVTFATIQWKPGLQMLQGSQPVYLPKSGTGSAPEDLPVLPVALAGLGVLALAVVRLALRLRLLP